MPMDYPVIDGHNDLAWACRQTLGYQVKPLADVQPHLHTDLPRLKQGRVGGQFWSVWVDPQLQGADQVTATLEQIDWVHRFSAQFPDTLQLASTAAQARAAMQSQKIASLIGVEGGDQIAESPAVLRQYARLGARYMTLTWSQTTSWADSATDKAKHGGLTDFGKQIVAEMNRIGMLVDLAHLAPETMHDALDVSSAPVLVSHSGARAVCDHPRNVPDDVLRRIGESGGIVMIAFVPTFLSEARRRWWISGARGQVPAVTVKDAAAHLEHIRDVAGIHAVGIGADFDGTDDMPTGLDDVSCYPALFAELADRGWSDSDLRAVASENILRVLEASDENYTNFMEGTTSATSLIAPAKTVEENHD